MWESVKVNKIKGNRRGNGTFQASGGQEDCQISRELVVLAAAHSVRW